MEGAKRFYPEVFGWTTADMDMGDFGEYTIFKRADGEADAGGVLASFLRDRRPRHTG